MLKRPSILSKEAFTNEHYGLSYLSKTSSRKSDSQTLSKSQSESNIQKIQISDEQLKRHSIVDEHQKDVARIRSQLSEMAHNLENLQFTKDKGSKRGDGSMENSYSAANLLTKYSQTYFNKRSISLGRLISTTDKAQSSTKQQVYKLHKILDRVELDRPYLIKDKITMIANVQTKPV